MSERGAAEKGTEAAKVVEKYVRDGKVAVLVSPGFGAGWSTWNRELGPDAIFSPALVEAVLTKQDPVTLAETLFPESYTGGVHSLKVEWVPVGARFRIDEYDGSESLELLDPSKWEVA